jgi:hypothetical protein
MKQIFRNLAKAYYLFNCHNLQLKHYCLQDFLIKTILIFESKPLSRSDLLNLAVLYGF